MAALAMLLGVIDGEHAAFSIAMPLRGSVPAMPGVFRTTSSGRRRNSRRAFFRYGRPLGRGAHPAEADDGGESRRRPLSVAANFLQRLASSRAMQTPTSTLVNPHCGGCHCATMIV